MNGKDRQDLGLVLQRLDQQDREREKQGEGIGERLDKMEERREKDHNEVKQSLHTIKVELFDPHKGLWAETKRNSRFRKTVTKAVWLVLPIFLYGVVAFVLEITPWAKGVVESF